MLGITTPDAIALGTLIFAGLAIWTGRKAGEVAKKVSPPSSSPLTLGMATFADTAMMGQLVAALDRVAEALDRGVAANDKRQADEVADRLQDMADKIDRMNDRRPR